MIWIRPLAVILAILTTKIRDVQRRDNPDLSCNIHWRNLYVSAGPKRGRISRCFQRLCPDSGVNRDPQRCDGERRCKSGDHSELLSDSVAVADHL